MTSCILYRKWIKVPYEIEWGGCIEWEDFWGDFLDMRTSLYITHKCRKQIGFRKDGMAVWRESEQKERLER